MKSRQISEQNMPPMLFTICEFLLNFGEKAKKAIINSRTVYIAQTLLMLAKPLLGAVLLTTNK